MNSNCGCNCNRRDNMYVTRTPCINEKNYTEKSPIPANYVYGYTYVPRQVLTETFPPEVGLMKGTIFPELVSEWCPGQSAVEMEFLRNSPIERGGYYA